jgi:tRNA A-37 threonylcarbamoyl transferase component Bud32
MGDDRICPACGATMPEGGPTGGLCPRCLIKQGLASQSPTQTGGHGSGRFVPPDPAELAEKFPQLEILELIGHGGMGAVYKARQPKLDRLVALKILAPDRVRDAAFAERFTREARALARLSHQHIVGIHDFGEAEGLYYFVMEYVDGANVREIMQAGRLSPQEALALVPQICDALQFAHDGGVVHRDIKPENILLDRAGRVKIADFGLAKLLEPGRADGVSLTVSGAVMGTPAYMAPEQIEHPLEVDHRADIYAVGVVFYEMLTGELPLGRFDPPSRKVRMDVRLDEVVLRALAKEPGRRYQLASDVVADLEELGRSETPVDSAAAAAAAVGPSRPGDGQRTTTTAGGPAEPGTRTIHVTRPAGVSWIAAYSLFMGGFLVLATLLVAWGMVAESVGALGLLRSGASAGGAVHVVGPRAVTLHHLTIMSGASFLMVLALWHAIAGFGALRLRNWARFNLIILAVLELPACLLIVLSGILFPSALVSVASVAILIYLFTPAIARIFQLGLGPATLPVAEADAIERAIGTRRWS